MQHVEQIENNPHCEAIQDYMKQKTGARSVPRVFINGRFFGGGDATVSAAELSVHQANTAAEAVCVQRATTAAR